MLVAAVILKSKSFWVPSYIRRRTDRICPIRYAYMSRDARCILVASRSAPITEIDEFNVFGIHWSLNWLFALYFRSAGNVFVNRNEHSKVEAIRWVLTLLLLVSKSFTLRSARHFLRRKRTKCSGKETKLELSFVVGIGTNWLGHGRQTRDVLFGLRVRS